MLNIILNIILIILKILGILLLSILGIVLVLTLIILFVPIRYKSVGDFEKDEGFAHTIHAKATWCLHIISVTFDRIDNKNNLVIKVFGIDIDKFKKWRNKSLNKRKIQRTKKSKRTIKENKNLETKSADNTKSVQKTTEIRDIKPKEVKVEEIKPKKGKPKDIDVKEAKPSIFVKIKNKLKDILLKIDNVCNKIKAYNNVKNSFIEYLRKDKSKLAIREIKKILYKLMKHILPRKLKAKFGFGFEDASTTGTALGILSMFYVIYGDNLLLEPDFDKQVLCGEYKLKGRIYIYFLLIVAWKLYKDEWIRDFVAFSKKTVKDL